MPIRSKLAYIRKVLSAMPRTQQSALAQWTEPFIAAVEAHGDGMRRADLWRILGQTPSPDLFAANGNINPDSRSWDHFIDRVRKLTADIRYWNRDEQEQLRRVRTAVELHGTLHRSDFVVLGGEADWVQNAEVPRCPTCSFLMHLFVQVKSPSAVSLQDEPELRDFEQSDSGTTYVFRCYQCSQYQVVEQYR